MTNVQYTHTSREWWAEGVVCQDARTEWSIAACDSWVAQLGETDNPQPVEADKTATSLLKRLNITSPGFALFLMLPLYPLLLLSL